jgi:hypothetical protein
MLCPLELRGALLLLILLAEGKVAVYGGPLLRAYVGVQVGVGVYVRV